MNLRTRAIAALAVIIMGVAAGALINRAREDGEAPTPRPTSRPRPSARTSPPPVPPARRPGPTTRRISLDAHHFVAYALSLDGRLAAGASNTDTVSQDTASLIKVWLAADDLTRTRQPSPARLADLEAMVRDSDNAAATRAYARLGERASIGRLVARCGLAGTTAGGGWSTTTMPVDDVARLGDCVRDGRAAGGWTATLLGWMRGVRGEGRFGIVEVYPDAAVKNGWVVRKADDMWHVACLGVGARWVLAVFTRYPAGLGLAYGAAVCRRVAGALTDVPGPPVLAEA